MFIAALGHAVLGLLLVIGKRWSVARRGLLLGLCRTVGVVLGLYVAVGGDSLAPWRSTAPTPAVGPAGVAVAAAWMLAGRGAHQAPLVGIAACGLVLAAAGTWAVPAMLFWMCSSVAVAVLTRASPGRVWVWVALALSDLCLAVGIAAHTVGPGEWGIPAPAVGTAFAALAAAAVLRATAAAVACAWRPTTAPAGLLIAGGGFVLMAGPAARPIPLLALWLLAWGPAAAALLVALARSQMAPDRLVASPAAVGVIATGMGVGFAAPAATSLAAAGTLVALTVLARLQTPRSIALPAAALVLPATGTVGFLAILAAAGASFGEATDAGSLAGAAPGWPCAPRSPRRSRPASS